MKLKCHHKSREATLATQTAYRSWLNNEIKHWYTRRHFLKLHQKLMHFQLLDNLHNIEFDFLDQQIREDTQVIAHKQYQQQLKKLNNLKSRKSNFVVYNNAPDNFTYEFYPRVKNLSDINFNKEETELLNKGLKFCPNISNDKDLNLFIVDIELALKKQHTEEDKANCVKIFKKHNPKSNNSDLKTVKSIKQKLVESNAVLCKADKGNTVTIFNKSEYIQKIQDILNPEQFTLNKKDPTSTYQTKITQLLKHCNTIFTEQEKYQLKNKNPQAPKLYALPKLHKADLPMRRFRL